MHSSTSGGAVFGGNDGVGITGGLGVIGERVGDLVGDGVG